MIWRSWFDGAVDIAIDSDSISVRFSKDVFVRAVSTWLPVLFEFRSRKGIITSRTSARISSTTVLMLVHLQGSFISFQCAADVLQESCSLENPEVLDFFEVGVVVSDFDALVESQVESGADDIRGESVVCLDFGGKGL